VATIRPFIEGRSYLLVTPCRDEAAHAVATLDSVVNQTILPAVWVIVDDGSTDETPSILERYARLHDFIRVVRRDNAGRRRVGGGVVEAFYEGYRSVDPSRFEYVCKLDLDLELPRTYFAELMDRMEADKRIGTISGKPCSRTVDGLVPEPCGDEMSVGMTKFYRRRCFEEIGGFVQEVMWDGIDCHRCRMLGWRALSTGDESLRFVHRRPMGSSHRGILTGRARHGRGQYFMGTGWGYMCVSALFRAKHYPLVVGGLAMLWGYAMSWLGRRPRYDDSEFRRFLRRFQRLCLWKGKAKATEQVERERFDCWEVADAAG